MKTIDYYLKLPYRLEIIPDEVEGGYVANFPDLPGCVTIGKSLEDVVTNSNDAKREWLNAALEDGMNIPEPRRVSDYSGQFKLRIPKSLHLSLVENARLEGVSMNQYCVYLLSQNNAQEAAK